MSYTLQGGPQAHDDLANRLVAELCKIMYRRGDDMELKDADLSAIELAQVRCNAPDCGLRVGAVVRTPAGPVILDLPARQTPYLLNWQHDQSIRHDAEWEAYQLIMRFHCIRHGSVAIGWDYGESRWKPSPWNRAKRTIPAKPNR